MKIKLQPAVPPQPKEITSSFEIGDTVSYCSGGLTYICKLKGFYYNSVGAINWYLEGIGYQPEKTITKIDISMLK